MRIFVIGLRAACHPPKRSPEQQKKKPPSISESYLMARMCPPGVGTYVRQLISALPKKKKKKNVRVLIHQERSSHAPVTHFITGVVSGSTQV